MQRMPLATSAVHEKDGIHGFATINAGPMASQRMWMARWEQWHHALSQLVGDTPVPAGFFVVILHHGPRSRGLNVPAVFFS
jgi:hypothetical protein